MGGSGVEVEATMSTNGSLSNGKHVDRLDVESFDPAAVVVEPVPDPVDEKREIVLGRNVHTTCLEVTEPDADDEATGDKDAAMASVLARYRKTLIERTKHHLGTLFALSVLVFVTDCMLDCSNLLECDVWITE